MRLNGQPEGFIRSILHADENPIVQITRLDIKNYLCNTLLRDMDSVTMAHSLEARAPFLDHELIEQTFQIPPTLKVKTGIANYSLYRA